MEVAYWDTHQLCRSTHAARRKPYPELAELHQSTAAPQLELNLGHLLRSGVALGLSKSSLCREENPACQVADGNLELSGSRIEHALALSLITAST